MKNFLWTISIFFILMLIPFKYWNPEDAVANQAASSQEWYHQTIAQSDDFGTTSSQSLQLDSAGHPHIAYAHSDGFLYYASYNGSAWQHQAVTILNDTISSPDTHPLPALAIDYSENPHISFVSNGTLHYASWSGTEWIIQAVDDEISGGSSLAIDAEGNPHISYHYYNQAHLEFLVKYATWTGTNWGIQIVDEGSNPSLALDSMGSPQISYSHIYLKFARKTNTGWDIQNVEQDGDFDDHLDLGWSSIDIDSNDNPHISYVRYFVSHGGSNQLFYARRTGNIWEIEKLAFGPGSGAPPALVLDKNDNPHISFVDQFGIYYARFFNSIWDIQTVAKGYNDPRGVSLAFDNNDNAHINYYVYDGEMIKLASQFPPLTLTSFATPRKGLTINDTITYTLSFSGPEHNVQIWDQLPENVEYVQGSITPPAIYSPTIRTIVWEGVLLNDMVQEISFQVSPTMDNGHGLSSPIVNTAWLTDLDYEEKSVSAVVIINGWESFLPIIAKAP